MKKLLFFAACLLLFTLSFHLIHFDHEHPKFLGEGMQAVMHGEDKKSWIVLLALSLLIGIGMGSVLEKFEINSPHAPLRSLSFSFDISKLFDPLRIMLRRGILHPLIYE